MIPRMPVMSPKNGYLSRSPSSHAQYRVCQQDKDEVLIDLGCQRRGGLAKAHRSCIDTWFRIRGSNRCDICQGIAANVPPPESQPSRIREYVTRRSQSVRSPRELAVAKAKLREIKALFNNYPYRHCIARDAEEYQRFSERIIALLAIDAIEACDFMVRASKRLMQNELDAMLDVVEPRPQGKLGSIRRRKFNLPGGPGGYSNQNEIAAGLAKVVQMLDQADQWTQQASVCDTIKLSCKTAGDAIVDAILDIAAASKMRASAIMKNEERFSISRCIKVLDEMQGEIPGEIGNRHDLQELRLPSNNLSGPIPSGIFNISRLIVISLSLNQLSGILPWSIGLTLPKLEELHLGGNRLSGNIPSSLSNASMLTLLDLAYNSFSGLIPNTISDLRSLKLLNLGVLTVKSSVSGSSFLSSLTNLTALEDLYLSDIPLNDVLPISIGNFNSLEILFLDYCNVKGSFPLEIGNLSNLTQLNLAFNEFSGSIPDAIGKLKNLQGLYLSDNELQGSIPTALCGMKSLNEFMSDNNKLNGSLPECLDNLISLRYFSSSFNRLTSTIPSSMWSLKDILYIDLSSNFINGSLPIEIGNLKVVTVLNLSRNQLSGDLPISFRDLKNLQNLSLEDNGLQGAIPDSFGDLTSLESLDLSNNNLSGEIPNSLEDLSFLKTLNLSFNNLEGEIPGGRSFANFSAQSFIGNKELCGDPQLQVPPCKTNSHRKKPVRLLIYILPGAAASTLLFLVIVFVLIRCRRRKQRIKSDDAEMSHQESWRRPYETRGVV
ncbi:hypothetical protein Q3G72_034721 [Acer saccharum]|nr:hypothetical protein Q3G72_034721 [Acer saccharum]